MILPFVVAAAASLTFEGIALGQDVAKIAAAHSGRATYTALGPAFVGDAHGKVAVVDFAADRGDEGIVELPQAGAFDLRASHAKLQLRPQSQ